MTLAAYLAGVSEEDEARCDQWNASGQKLRAAVAWRIYQGKGQILAGMTGVSLDMLQRFIDTGEIDETHRRMLEVMS